MEQRRQQRPISGFEPDLLRADVTLQHEELMA